MLATPGKLPEDETAWTFEIKWDGVRALSYVEGGTLQLESRNLLDITPRYPELAALPAGLQGHDAILDGEVVTFDDEGRPSFGRLQHRMHVTDSRQVQHLMVEYPIAYLVFDVLWLDGRSLMAEPLDDRRAALEGLGLDEGGPPWQVSKAFPGQGHALLAATKERGLEGVVAKRRDSTYEPGRRSRCWLKVKNVNRQEVVIGGWLEGSGNRSGRIGALLVGYWEGDRLRFAGKVGTGFTDQVLAGLAERLASLDRPTSPFADPVPWKGAHWVEPVLVADVEFTEWTAAGTLRHPSYKGLRSDKASRDVVREPT
ncbi:MAG TPA: non-homologous end-joining DNA ligase [Acidimicrobiales bacterium]|nr:non-homologous end-joining DNA ligase [Acidimicrobiales bacterium]